MYSLQFCELIESNNTYLNTLGTVFYRLKSVRNLFISTGDVQSINNGKAFLLIIDCPLSKGNQAATSKQMIINDVFFLFTSKAYSAAILSKIFQLYHF